MGDIDEALLAAFAEEGVEIRSVSAPLVEPASVDPEFVRYVVHFLLQGRRTSGRPSRERLAWRYCKR